MRRFWILDFRFWIETYPAFILKNSVNPVYCGIRAKGERYGTSGQADFAGRQRQYRRV